MILVATGLKREARILRGRRLSIVTGGGHSRELERALETQAQDAEAIISIGLAGALQPALYPGAWVIAEHVADERGHRIATHPGWRAALAAALRHAARGDVLGSDEIAASARAKAALAARHAHILAVDMESHIAARVAARANKPFAAARTISDSSASTLPPAALIAMKGDGGIDLAAVLGSLLRAPAQLTALLATALEAESGFRALVRGRKVLGDGLGFPGLDVSHRALDVV